MGSRVSTAATLGSRLSRFLTATRRAFHIVQQEGGRGLTERLEFHRNRSKVARAYRVWVEHYDTLTDEDRRDIRGRIEGLAYRPVISVVMPVYDADEIWLRRAVRSVTAQLYPNWELCVADDHSPRPHVRAVLEELASQDPRIKVLFRQENGHISAASNSALELVTGEFVAFLDHDDELTEHALYLVAEELNAHPEADLLYSDEDKIDEHGERYLPHFKPDWNPDLLRCINFVSHLAVCRTRVVKQVGGLRVGFEGAQDYDFVLRVADEVPQSHIRHIPHILYHWRSIPGSMARAMGEKTYVPESGRKALASHFQRRGIAARIEAAPGCAYRPVYPLVTESRVSLVVSADDPVQLRWVLGLIDRTRYNQVEVVLVLSEKFPQRDAIDLLAEQQETRWRPVRAPAEFGPTARLNYGACHAAGEVLGFLRPVEPLSPGWLTEMVSHALRPEIGAVGARLYRAKGTIDQAGLVLGLRGLVGRAYHDSHPRVYSFGRMIERTEWIQNYSAVSESCLLMRRSVFDQVGGFDQANLPSAYQDVDLCLRIAEHGYRVLWTPFAELRSMETNDVGLKTAQQEAYVRNRWAPILRSDPCYNPNLTLEREDFSFATPPRAPKPWRAAEKVAPGPNR